MLFGVPVDQPAALPAAQPAAPPATFGFGQPPQAAGGGLLFGQPASAPFPFTPSAAAPAPPQEQPTMLFGVPAQVPQGLGAASPVSPAFGGGAALTQGSRSPFGAGFSTSPVFGSAAPRIAFGQGMQQQQQQQREEQAKQPIGEKAKADFQEQLPGGGGGSVTDDDKARRQARMARFGQGGDAGGASDGGEGGPRPRRVPPPSSHGAAAAQAGLRGSAAMDDKGTAGAIGPVDPEAMVVVGTCEEMCPEAERKRREQENGLHQFERVGGNPKVTSCDLIVKRNVRNYDSEKPADWHPSSFRTFGALDKTMRHLRGIMDWTPRDHPDAQPITVYNFLWDRYREVRKEISTQRFNTKSELLPQVLAWNEEVARYHISCSHELISTEEFSSQLNQEQLNKIILDLLRDYRTCVDLGVPTPSSGEFKCYMAIMTFFGLENKGGNKIPNKIGALEVLRSFTLQEQVTSWFPLTLGILTTIATMDVRGYMQIAKAAPYPLACVLFAHYWDMKEHGFKIAPAAYSASEDPSNVVPTTALVPFFDLTTKGIKAKCRGMGAEVGPYPDDPSLEAVRFPHPSRLSHAPSKKQVQPWISNKGGSKAGAPSTAIVNPPALSQALLDLIARIQGKAPGSYSPHHPPTIHTHIAHRTPSPAPAPATEPSPSLSNVSQPPTQQQPEQQQPSATPSLSGAIGTPPPTTAAATSAAAPKFGAPGPSVSLSPFAPAFTPSQPSSAPARPFAFGAAPSPPPASLPAAPAPAPAFGAAPPAFGGLGQGVPQALHGATAVRMIKAEAAEPGGAPQAVRATRAVPAPSSPAASLEAVAQAQAAAEAAISQAKAQEAQARRAQEALQAQVAAQQQQQQQHALHAQQQYMRQLEDMQRSAQQQTQVLQQQVAAQAAQLAALAQQRQLVEAELRKRRTHEQGQKLQAELERNVQLRGLSKWRAATQAQKEREARMQEQLARCRIDRVAGGALSPAFRLPPRTPAASPEGSQLQQAVAGKRRRQDGTAGSPFTPTPPQALSSVPSPISPPIFSHLPLPAFILPELRSALYHASIAAMAAAAAPVANGQAAAAPLFSAPQPRAAPAMSAHAQQQQQQVQEQASQVPLFWKVVMSTGVHHLNGSRPPTAHAPPQGSTSVASPPPVSSLQVAAASWLRAKLACGRNGTPFPPPAGELLALLHVPLDPDAALQKARAPVPSHATLCVEDLDPRTVAADSPPLPRYSSRSMAATAGILLLASGPSPPLHPSPPSPSYPPPNPNSTSLAQAPFSPAGPLLHAASLSSACSPLANGATANGKQAYTPNGMQPGSSMHHQHSTSTSTSTSSAGVGGLLGAGVQAELAASWEDLQVLLCGLAPGVQVPLVVLALTDSVGVEAVRAHLEATAGRWPPELTARIARCTVVPLLPQHQAEAGLIYGLRQLAAYPPAPLLAAGCCGVDGAWAGGALVGMWGSSGGGSGGGAAAAGLWGAPQRVALEALVRDLLEACLQQHEHAAGSAQDVVLAFNDGLAALAHGVHSTATCAAATWGLPPPETAPSPHMAAPLCWHQASVAAVAQELLQAQVSAASLPAAAGAPSAAAMLHAHFARWASLRTGPTHCLLLPQFLAPATAPPALPSALTPATTSSSHVRAMASSFLARSPGGFVRPSSTPPLQAASSSWQPSPMLTGAQQQTEWGSRSISRHPATNPPSSSQQQASQSIPVPSSPGPAHAMVAAGASFQHVFARGSELQQPQPQPQPQPQAQQEHRGATRSGALKSKAQRILLQLGSLVPGASAPSSPQGAASPSEL